jgi:hypothetical protein
MKLEKMAALAEIISSVAIVATLAYLAIQAQQTNRMLLGDSRQAALEADLTILSSQINNPEVASRILGYDVEDVQNQALLISFMRIREYQWLQFNNGTLDREAFESYVSPVAFWLSSEIGAEWWTGGIQSSFDAEFVEFVDQLVSTQRDPLNR